MENSAPAARGNNLLLGLIGGGLAAYFGVKLYNTAALKKELQIDQKVSLDPSTSLTGVKLRVDLTLKNPTNGTITVKRPVVTIFFNQSQIGTTDEVADKDYVVPQFGQVTLDPIFITVSPMSGLLAAVQFIKQLSTTKAASVTVRSLTLINGSIPYERTDLIPLFK